MCSLLFYVSSASYTQDGKRIGDSGVGGDDDYLVLFIALWGGLFSTGMVAFL